MASLLTDNEIQAQLSELPGWSLSGKSIQCVKTFRNFIEAIDFVNALVSPAEAAGHHPDLTISYNKVTISLTTHDAGGLTDQDFSMARTLSQLA
jgi:4a-hydroxytetrahydrobiopterin dehydratase